MADVNVTPQTVLLTGMQTATFQATDAAGAPLAVTWIINPATGAITPAPPATSASGTYTAPQQVPNSQSVTVTATSAAGVSASATVCLTPNAVEIIPASVDLKETQKQQFNAVVAGDPANRVTWNLSPQIGTIVDGLYAAPDSLSDSTTVTVLATTAVCKKTGRATVTLVPPPWTGPWRNVVGVYLLAVFSLVCFLIALWPPSLPDAATARADRLEAEKTVKEKSEALKLAQAAVDGSNSADRTAANPKDKNVSPGSKPGTGSTSNDASDASVSQANAGQSANDKNRVATSTATTSSTDKDARAAAATKADAAKDALQKAQQEKKAADDDLAHRQAVEKETTSPSVNTALVCQISRDVDLLLLVLLGGALGSFLHSARSFADFVGNQKIKGSWAWWYFLHPFMGAGLALVFFMALRGGFMAITTGSNIKAADLSPFGVTSIAALVGMFSKQATQKLAEVFETVFKAEKAKELKDPLGQATPTQTPASGSSPASGTPAKPTP